MFDLFENPALAKLVLSYLPTIEVLHMQAINRFTYGELIGKILIDPWRFVKHQRFFYYTDRHSKAWRRRLIVYDALHHKSKIITNKCFNFYGHQTLQVGHNLFAIKEDGLVVSRYHGGANIAREKRQGLKNFKRFSSSAVNFRN